METNFYVFFLFHFHYSLRNSSDVGNLWIFDKWSIDVSGSGASIYLDNVPMVLL